MTLLDWFRTRRRQAEATEQWWEAVGRLEHDMKQLQLEWEETYGKVRRALATLAKRQQREEGRDAGEPNGPSLQRAVDEATPSDYAKLRAMYPRR